MRARKSLGQHFLVDVHHQRRIVEALGCGPGDAVLEIGPGRGALTEHLVGRAEHLHLVELDEDLAERLEARYGGRSDTTVHRADILDIDLTELVDDPGRLLVIGNIPYNITTPILFHLLSRPRPRSVLIMVQREVADRILAEPGTSAYGALSVGVRTVASCERVTDVPRGAFRPVPDVDSTVIRIRPLDPPPLTPAEEERLRTLVRAAFQWRRKQFQKTLRDHPELALGRAGVDALAEASGFDLTRRPETFSPDDFVTLSRCSGPHGSVDL